MIDDAMVEQMAEAAWRSTHDGSWDDPHCCEAWVKESYRTEIKAALAALGDTHMIVQSTIRKQTSSTSWVRNRRGRTGAQQRGEEKR